MHSLHSGIKIVQDLLVVNKYEVNDDLLPEVVLFCRSRTAQR